ncbi:Uma2 family endonuclease [Clostridium sp. AM42-4]|uniref:Uma2 family endonuclease n=1 Tax=Clostridium sp. AM42-4 TaxID=2292305 RepID=UPI000E54BA16|nr:Uma2 family endonuclease [Clostridium sp. AM42-4]RHS90156.1 Uma2 family endonuclease [Clostridium sp. AM42-4]
MPLLKDHYTAEDYWNLSEGERAELIDGKFYNMAPPSLTHQTLSIELASTFRNYIKSKGGSCRALTAPFAVNLDANDKNWVEPDVMVVCNRDKLTERSCIGAPDLIIEIVSPSSRKIDYIKKNALYLDAGVKEYWIVDPMRKSTLVYCYDEDATPIFYPFDTPIAVGIYPDLSITIADLLQTP